MNESEINITYETLYELLRREKNREEIQELSPTFFDDLKDYLNSKKQMANSDSSAQSPEQVKKAQVQFENIKKILKELYEKRERKIINMALTGSRTASDILETEKLLGIEKSLYGDMKSIFDRYRKSVLLKIINGELPSAVDLCEGREDKEPQETPSENQKSVDEQKKPVKDTLMIRFLQPVPKFVGKELETYGPFDKDDIVTLPTNIAQVLIRKERAEEITAE